MKREGSEEERELERLEAIKNIGIKFDGNSGERKK